MKRGWKIAMFGLVGLVAVAALALGGLRWWLDHRLSADAIVAEMERNYNSRVEVGSRQLKVFSRPARVELQDVRMAPRDELADQGVPASRREPLGENGAPLHLREAVITMNLPDLIRGNLDIEEVRFHGLRATVRQGEDGDNIGRLFDKPELINGLPNPKLEEERLRQERREREREERRQARREARDLARAEGRYEEWRAQDDADREERRRRSAEDDDEDDEKSPFRAEDLKMRLLIARGHLDDVEVNIRTTDERTEFLLDDMRYGLANVDVDPDALAQFNHADLTVEGRLQVRSLRSGRHMADVRFDGAGPMRPFELEEGIWLPDIRLDISLLQGSSFAGMPMFESLGKWLELLAAIGLNLTGLDLAGSLVEDANTALHYHNGYYEFTKAFELVFETYRLSIRRGAWIDAVEDQHRIRGTLLGDPEWTAEALAGVSSFVRRVAGEESAERFTERVREAVVDEEGRLRLDFTSEGALSDPDFKVKQKIPDLRDAARDVGRDILRNLFR